MGIEVGFYLCSEVLQNVEHRRAGSLAQTTVGDLHHIFANLLKHVQVARDAFPLGNPAHYLEHPLGAYPAEGAFAAAFKAEELHNYFGQVNDAGIFVTDQQSARAQGSACLSEGFEVHRGVLQAGWDD